MEKETNIHQHRQSSRKTPKISSIEYKELFKHLNSGAVILKHDKIKKCFICLDLNKTGEKICQVDKKSIIKKDIIKLFPGLNKSGLKKVLNKVNRSGGIENFDYCTYKDEKIIKWLELFIYKLLSDNIIIIFNDVTRRKKNEKILREYKKAVDGSSDLITAIDKNYNYLFANNAFLEYFQSKRDEIEGHTLEEIFNKEMFESVIKPYFDKCLKGQSVNFEMEYDYPKSGKRNMSVTYFPLKNNKDKVSGVVGVIKDITVQKELNLEREFTIKVLKLLNKSDDLNYVINKFLILIDNYIKCDAIGIRLKDGNDFPYYKTKRFGNKNLSHESIEVEINSKGDIKKDKKGYPVYNCICGNVIYGYFDGSLPFFSSQGSFWVNDIYDFLKTQTNFKYSSLFIDLYSKYKYKSTAFIPVRTKAMSLGLLHLSNKSKYKFTEDNIAFLERLCSHLASWLENYEDRISLGDSEERFRVAAKSFSDIIYEWNILTGEFEWFGRIDKLLGYKYGEFPRTIEAREDIIHPDDLKHVKKSIKAHLQNKIPYSEEYRVKKKNGDILYIEDRGLALRDEQDKPYKWIGVNTNITQQKDLLEQLIQSEKLSSVGQLSAGVAHEFNNVLAIIRGNVQLLVMGNKAKKDEELFEALKIIEKQTINGANIVRNMMAFASPKKPEKELCFIQKVIDEVHHLQEKQLKLENIKIEKEYTHDLIVNIDKGQMHQVFLNLFINARHAIKPNNKGKIKISINKIANKVEVRFLDTGVGMDEDVIFNVFNPFYTTKGASARDGYGLKGTGLGLSVTRAIINNHEGKIFVESENGVGSEFVILLPIDKSEEEKTDEKEVHYKIKKVDGFKDLTVLVVDDEKTITKLMSNVLKKIGVGDIIAVGSGLQALTYLKDKHFDVVFLDVLMPDMDGKMLLKEIQKMNLNIPVVFMSGYTDLDKGFLKSKEVMGFLQKPFNLNDIHNILKQVLRKKS